MNVGRAHCSPECRRLLARNGFRGGKDLKGEDASGEKRLDKKSVNGRKKIADISGRGEPF